MKFAFGKCIFIAFCDINALLQHCAHCVFCCRYVPLLSKVSIIGKHGKCPITKHPILVWRFKRDLHEMMREAHPVSFFLK